jgi:oligosaccharide repeat unit polymerase
MNIYALVIAKYLSVSKVKSFFRFYRLELILAVFLVSPSLIAGDRGAFISFILFFCGVFFLKTKKKLNVPALVIVGFSLAFVISILGIRRQGNSLNESVKIFSSKGKSISNATYELSGSVQSLLIALDNIPNVYPHLYGLTMADELLLLVPGATDFVLNLLSVPPQMRFSPQYLTFIALGPKSSWGVGSTCVADVYVNFGSLGVPIIFFLFGIMCYIIDNASLKRNLKPAMLIFVLIAYSYSVYISRATLLTTITGFIYVYLIYTVFLKRTVNNNIKNASI